MFATLALTSVSSGAAITSYCQKPLQLRILSAGALFAVATTSISSGIAEKTFANFSKSYTEAVTRSLVSAGMFVIIMLYLEPPPVVPQKKPQIDLNKTPLVVT